MSIAREKKKRKVSGRATVDSLEVEKQKSVKEDSEDVIKRERLEQSYSGERKGSTDSGKLKSRKSTGTRTSRDKSLSKTKDLSMQSLDAISPEMSEDEDVVFVTIPETSQKIVHCQIGHDLFVDKTWCLVKKADILEDVAIQDTNSPFFNLVQRILDYKPTELMIGYEPFSPMKDRFMLCVTEAGRDGVARDLETLKETYIRRIQQSKEIEPKTWESLGSEEFVDQFQIKNSRKLISLEWIGDITKRCFEQPVFEDCEPDNMKNGYTCLVPADKNKFELIFNKTQETGVQAVAQKDEASAQTEPEIPTNASTQYAPETEITIPDADTTQAAIKSKDLNAFFEKYLDYLLESLNYNEVYDLYHDDYPALYVAGEETQVQQMGTYHQYQSFTDVAAIEGKLVTSSSWHPNYTGVVAVAYANEIPCLMTELEFDSDQTDYEEEKTDDEMETGEEPELGIGARDWLEDERRERESTGENTELFDKAIKKLKDIESANLVWDAKIQEDLEEAHRTQEDSSNEETASAIYHYVEYKEPEPEPEVETVGEEEGTTEVSGSQVLHDYQEEVFGTLGTEETGSQKTKEISLREQLEADMKESIGESEISLVTEQDTINTQFMMPEIQSDQLVKTRRLFTLTKSSSEPNRSVSVTSHRATHHKKRRRNVPREKRQSLQFDQRSEITHYSSIVSSSLSDPMRGLEIAHDISQAHEQFDEVTDEEEIKEKRDELPLLEVNNPVLIWSFVDDLTPKLRLDSPYEVRVVAFSQHDGNLLAGGTASGQVVLWDITGRIEELEKPEALTQNQQTFRKRMEDLMSWRLDIRSKRRVSISAITNQMESHLQKITDLTWVGPTIVVTDSFDIIKNPSPEPTLQLMTCSINGDIKVWDLKSEPIKTDYKKQVTQFKTKERFGRPPSLDKGLSPYTRLHKRWKSILTFVSMSQSLPVLMTGFNPHNVPVKYMRAHPKLSAGREVLEDRVEYRAVPAKVESIPLQLYVSDLFGKAGTITWEAEDGKVRDGEYIHHTCRFWDSYHDGPVHRIQKHPFLPNVCLTAGGHVFSIWHVNSESEPILSRRYFGVYITDGSWSLLRPSLIRIARSDGVVEIWDLIIQNHAPATTIIVSGRVITSISPPLLPEVRGLLGVADYNSAFRLFFIPQQFRVWTQAELDRLTLFINREPERKQKMKEWSKWWRENNVNPEREEKKQAEEKKKLDEEVRLEKEKQEEARKKYNEEVYKWYMRRRGKPFLWREEAEEKWRIKQEEHMHETIMAKKKIDRDEMELLMRPIMREEKNEAQKHAKAQERLQQADSIFRQTVELIFPKSSKTTESFTTEEESMSDVCNKLVDYYLLENFTTLSDEQVELIERSPWQLEFEWSELLEKYNALRMLFNDRRRKRSKTLRWLRKKLREELLKEGRKVHIRKSHMARYPKRKIKRRHENLDWLKKMYGDDYNVYWDKHHPCRRFADRKFCYDVEEMESMLLDEFLEPDVEDQEVPQFSTGEETVSNLELITEMGIEHIPEEIFAADLDTTLITLESRSSLGVKSVPSFKKPSRAQSAISEQSKYLTVPTGYDSPQDDSDVSVVFDAMDDTTSIQDNQIQELDYIQQSIGTKINTLQTMKTPTTQKREISVGVKIVDQESVSFEEDNEAEDSIEDAFGSKEEQEGSIDEDAEQVKTNTVSHDDNYEDDDRKSMDESNGKESLEDS